MAAISEPEAIVLEPGVSYRVELRATPGRGVDGYPNAAGVMWSADLIVWEGGGLVAHGATAIEALDALGALVRSRM